MMAFKAFNKNLQATLGKGTYQFKAGKTYEEKECKCAHNGFHCAEDPLCALGYYDSMDTRFFVVNADGDINQDGVNSRISCTKLTLVKEISRIELAAYACRYMEKYPEREIKSSRLHEEKGKCMVQGDFIIVRGKNPRAAGVEGSYFFLVKEKKGSHEIQTVYPAYVDGRDIKEGIYYGLRGDELCEKKN